MTPSVLNFYLSLFQFCEYYPDYEGCKKWLETNLPDKFASLEVSNADEDGAGGEDAKKRQKRGGKGMMKAKKKEQEIEKKICLSIAPRGKRKSVTVVQGLKTFGRKIRL